MPLPLGTLKNKLQLRTQADNTFKTNGGAGIVKTGGNNERQFWADVLESLKIILDEPKIFQTNTMPTIKFDGVNLYVGNTSYFITGSGDITLDIPLSTAGSFDDSFDDSFDVEDILLSSGNDRVGAICKVYVMRATKPNISYTSNIKLYAIGDSNTRIWSGKEEFWFQYLGYNGSKHLVMYNRVPII